VGADQSTTENNNDIPHGFQANRDGRDNPQDGTFCAELSVLSAPSGAFFFTDTYQQLAAKKEP